MSPPIRDGSGNSINSIRLGDGSEISEVRTGAGDVLFSASAIPDSVTNQWRMDEGSGTTLNDSVGSSPASLQKTGLWVSDSNSEGGFHTDYNDNTDEYWITDSSVGFNGQVTVLQWVNVDGWPSGTERLLYYGEGDGTRENNINLSARDSDTLHLFKREGGTFSEPAGLSVSPLSGGNWYLIAATLDGSNNDINLYVFDSNGLLGSGNATFDPSFLPPNSFMAGAYDGSGASANTSIDAPAISTSTAMSQSEIDTYRQQTR